MARWISRNMDQVRIRNIFTLDTHVYLLKVVSHSTITTSHYLHLVGFLESRMLVIQRSVERYAQRVNTFAMSTANSIEKNQFANQLWVNNALRIEHLIAKRFVMS